MRLLVMRRGGLGDTLLMLPLLRCLRRAHPGAALHFAGVPEFAELFVPHGIVDVVMSIEDIPVWRPAQARARLAAFERVIGDVPDVVTDGATDVLDPLALDSGTAAGLQFARQVGLAPRWPDDGWLVPPHGRSLASAHGPIVLAPGSGGAHKCWPQERWLELARQLAPTPLACVVGPTEVEREDPRGWSWPRSVEFVVGRTLAELAESLRGARGYVGNDSGTTHLAAALGLPTMALFGPTDPAVWAPVGEHVRVLVGAAGSLADLEAAAVVAALPSATA